MVLRSSALMCRCEFEQAIALGKRGRPKKGEEKILSDKVYRVSSVYLEAQLRREPIPRSSPPKSAVGRRARNGSSASLRPPRPRTRMEKEHADNVSIKPQHGNSLCLHPRPSQTRKGRPLQARDRQRDLSQCRRCRSRMAQPALHASLPRASSVGGARPEDAGGLATGYQCPIRGTLTVAPLGRLRHPLQLVADVRPASYFPSVENSSAPAASNIGSGIPKALASGQRGSCRRPGRGAYWRVSTKPAFFLADRHPFHRRPSPASRPRALLAIISPMRRSDHLRKYAILAHQAALSLALGAARDAAR